MTESLSAITTFGLLIFLSTVPFARHPRKHYCYRLRQDLPPDRDCLGVGLCRFYRRAHCFWRRTVGGFRQLRKTYARVVRPLRGRGKGSGTSIGKLPPVPVVHTRRFSIGSIRREAEPLRLDTARIETPIRSPPYDPPSLEVRPPATGEQDVQEDDLGRQLDALEGFIQVNETPPDAPHAQLDRLQVEGDLLSQVEMQTERAAVPPLEPTTGPDPLAFMDQVFGPQDTFPGNPLSGPFKAGQQQMDTGAQSGL